MDLHYHILFKIFDMKNKFLVYYSIVFSLISCEKEAAIIVPKADEKIVVNALLEPNKEIEVFVSKTYHYQDNSLLNLTDAIVTLTTNNQKIDTLSYNKNGTYSKTNLKAVSGNHYSLKVIHSNFPIITASDYVPYPPQIDSVLFISNNLKDEQGNIFSEFRYYLHDNKDETNYYVPYIHATKSILYSSGVALNQPSSSFFSQVFYNEHEIPQENYAYSDSIFNGLPISISVFYPNLFIAFLDDSLYKELDSKLYAVSSTYYLYHLSVKKYNSQHNLHSNIINGYGIFAGIAKSVNYIWNETITE